jgi:hypothetical protein
MQQADVSVHMLLQVALLQSWFAAVFHLLLLCCLVVMQVGQLLWPVTRPLCRARWTPTAATTARKTHGVCTSNTRPAGCFGPGGQAYLCSAAYTPGPPLPLA